MSIEFRAFRCHHAHQRVHSFHSPLLRSARCALFRVTQRTSCQAASIDFPQALLFDCDGVLVDTERDGHRVAFNAAFRQKGLPHEWDVSTYGKLLRIGGGKERMNAFFLENEDLEPYVSVKGLEGRTALLREIHALKTSLFQDMVASGALPLRPGVAALIDDAIQTGVKVAVCSTSSERAVQTIVNIMLGTDVAKVMRVFAGDVVASKKPDPEIYTLAATALGVPPAQCVVIEDSHIGVTAAKAAGMHCIATASPYTEAEDLSAADAVFDCIGAPGEARFTLTGLADLCKAKAITAQA